MPPADARATLFLLVGLPGAGKTTRAVQLEATHHALRLTPDEWMQALFGAGEFNNKRAVLEFDLLWGVAARALRLGLNVVLDYGCWSRSERLELCQRAHAVGARAELHALHPPMSELWRRLEARNQNLPANTFRISQEELLEYAGLFETPDQEELVLFDAAHIETGF